MPPADLRQWPLCQQLSVRASDPGRELLAIGAVGLVVTQQPLDVVGQPVRGDLEPAQLAAEARVGAERAAQVHLEALLAVDDRALQADVGQLEPGARIH